MHLAERRKELGVLKGLLAHCRQNRGQIALITGGIATGKTQLLNAFANHALESDVLVLTATCSRAEQTLPLGVMGQLCQGAGLPPAVRRRATELLDEHARLPTAPQGDREPLDGPDAKVLHGLCALILDLAREQPLVLGIDDVHFADPQSLQALLYLQRRMRSVQVLMILSEWTRPRPKQLPFHSEVTRLPYFSRLRLAPLSRTGVADVLAQQLHPETARQLAMAYHQKSGGNPLLVHALLEDYLASENSEDVTYRPEPVVGEAFGQAVLTCLHRWEPILLEVARGLAVLDESASPQSLGRLLDLPADSAAQALDVLTMAGLLDNARFRHPTARDAVLNSLPAAEFARLHLRAAELLHQDGEPVTVIAEHLVAAGQAGIPSAVQVLRAAAEQVLADDDAELATRYLELAHGACTDEREGATIATLLAHSEWRGHSAPVNLPLTRMRTALERGHLNDRGVFTLIKHLLWSGHTDEAAKTLRTLIQTDSLVPSFAADLRLTYHILSFSHPPFFPRIPGATPPLGNEPLSLPATPWRRATIALATVLTQGPTEAAIDGAEHVLQTCTLTDETLDSLLTALLTLLYADRPDKAAPWCDALVEEATSRRATPWRALLGNLRADIALRQGDLLVAAEYARTALAQLPPPEWGVGIGAPLATLILATTAMGDYEEAATLLKRPVPESMFGTWFAPQYLYARGHYFLATERPHAALTDFHNCGTLMVKWNIDHPAIASWRSGVAKAHLHLGRRDHIGSLMADQLALPGVGLRTRGISLRMLAAGRGPDQRLPLLEEAVDLLRISGDQFELATTFADLSRLHHEKGDSSTAQALAEQAMELAKQCQATPLFHRLLSGRETVDIGSGGRGETDEVLGVLSNAERRVASLAALGHTNRAIARKLGITVSTVEQHLTRVYRKLNVSRRTQLPVELPVQTRPRLELEHGHRRVATGT
ncbi:ATP-binding protein [Amycolatopsis anabasis]|uniref:ATP-binding protein n=1 Tax=Amycolatopsis anabasis TaxID=1840409 RepID=UPI00131DE74C|nr:LuxR family transcriptional regulator [Amycolatopsis anabasis]